MRIACIAAAALAVIGCADAPPREARAPRGEAVTGSNIPKRDPDRALEGVTVYTREALESAQERAHGAGAPRDPNTPR